MTVTFVYIVYMKLLRLFLKYRFLLKASRYRWAEQHKDVLTIALTLVAVLYAIIMSAYLMCRYRT